MRKSIIRSDKFGVFFAEVAEQTTTTITLKNARNIHYWDGAASTLQLAVAPTKLTSSTRITMEVSEITLTGDVAIIPCTEVAEKFLNEFPVWKI